MGVHVYVFMYMCVCMDTWVRILDVVGCALCQNPPHWPHACMVRCQKSLRFVLQRHINVH